MKAHGQHTAYQESSHVNHLLNVATRRFLRDGYTLASVTDIAQEARVSTRTIYKRFTNKAGLWVSVIERLMMRDMEVVLATAHFDATEPRQALTAIGEFIYTRACAPAAASLFRMAAADVQRFPDRAATIHSDTKLQLENAVVDYLRRQNCRGTLSVADPVRAATLFIQMVCAELRECQLFGPVEKIAQLDHKAHLDLVVDIFLNGMARRNEPPGTSAVIAASGAIDRSGC
jgi:AcrR family transcriptional regulator